MFGYVYLMQVQARADSIVTQAVGVFPVLQHSVVKPEEDVKAPSGRHEGSALEAEVPFACASLSSVRQMR